MFNYRQATFKRTLTRLVLACIGVLQLSTFVFVINAQAASAPNIVNYQGRVLNANGIPVADASLSMIFQLYTSSSTGSCVWSNSSATCATATARTVALTDGLFSESLGDTSSSYAAIGDSIFAENAALYLQVTVAGETLSPRKQIVASPYALNSDTLDGLDADTDGSTSSAIVALNSSGNVVFTGDPSGAAVSAGVVYINPPTSSSNETLFGVGDGNTDRFRIDKEGDVFIKTIELDGAGTDNASSGASLVGTFDEFSLSSSTTVQDVLDDLDQSINDIVTGGGASKWTDAGTFTHLTSATDDLVIGGSSVAGASLFFDESAGQLDLGTDSALAGTLRLFSVTAATSDPTLAADSSGNLDITAATVELSGDVAVNGGDLTTTGSTFNLLAANATTVNTFAAATVLNINDGAVTSTIDIGGVTSDGVNTINIATNATSADTLAFGNAHASTTVAITGGDDWSITDTGVLTLSTSVGSSQSAIVITDGDYTNALSIGDNMIFGTTSAIDFTNFDVGTSGNILVAASAGLDTNGSGSLMLGNSNATAISVCNSAACDTILLGTNADADVITIGDVLDTVGVNASQWSVSGSGTGTFADLVCTDCLTFTEFGDSMSLDAATTFDTGAFGLIFATTTQTTSPVLSLDMNSPSMSGASGDGINFDNSATYTAATTVSGNVIDISRALVNNSAGLLTTSGDLLSIVSNNSNSSGTLTDTADLISLTQSNTAATGNGIIIANAGTGSSIFLDPAGNTGTTVSSSVGGALHVENTNNANFGLTVYTNTNSTAASPVAFIFADNTAYDVNVAEIRNDSTSTTASSSLVLTQNVVADATTAATSQALVINVNESSNSDEVILILSDADGTPDAEFRFENDGDLFGDGASYNAGADYAEFFYTLDGSLADHHVVCQDLSNNLAVKKCAPGDRTVIGVVSTNPGFVGNNIPGADGSLEGNPSYRMVGLEGQVVTHVTAADGAVAVGDPLTASGLTAGYAGKSTSAGRIIGFALEPMASGSGLIKVRVSPTWHAGEILEDDGEVGSFATTLALESLATATAGSPASGSNVLAFRGSAWNGSAADTLTMSLSNRVTNASNYRLSVSNTAGSEVAYINNLGDLVLSGKLYPSNQGTAQTSAYIYYDSNGVGYMRTNAAGWGTGSYDFAEMFPSSELLAPGEVVVFGDADEQVKRSTGQTYDDRIAGVVSTRPGFLAGTYRPGDSPIALSGRVPTKVNTENGPINIGDPLTTSSTPGVAMKATEPGPIVGYAMQSLASGSGMMTVFIRASYYDGYGSEPAIVAAPISQVGSASELSSLNLNGGPITSVSSITGLGNTWRLTETGDLVTQGRLVQVVKSHQNEDVETYAAATREMTIQISGTATLNNNTASVDFEAIDPDFNDIISPTAAYRVLATPSGVTGQIYVTNRTATGFTIRAESSADGVLVDWLVIAYHKDYEPVLEEEPITDPEPVAEDEVLPEPDVAEDPVVEPLIEEPIIDETSVAEPITEELSQPDVEGPVIDEPPVEEPVELELAPEPEVAP